MHRRTDQCLICILLHGPVLKAFTTMGSSFSPKFYSSLTERLRSNLGLDPGINPQAIPPEQGRRSPFRSSVSSDSSASTSLSSRTTTIVGTPRSSNSNLPLTRRAASPFLDSSTPLPAQSPQTVIEQEIQNQREAFYKTYSDGLNALSELPLDSAENRELHFKTLIELLSNCMNHNLESGGSGMPNDLHPKTKVEIDKHKENSSNYHALMRVFNNAKMDF